MIRTVYVTVGNSDDKLTQARWASFANETFAEVEVHATELYGVWTSNSIDEYQNACICFGIDETETEALIADLAKLAQEYGQDSIAWAWATLQFVRPDGTMSTDPAPATAPVPNTPTGGQ